MPRCRCRLLPLFLLLACACLARAAGWGSVVLVKVAGNAADAPADVYRQTLPDGNAQLLLAHSALPVDFQGRIDRALPSANGDMLLLGESIGVLIRDTSTGATRQVFGNSYGLNSHEKVERNLGGRYWLWTRATNAFRLAKITTGKETLFGPDLRWSPVGRLLLASIADPRISIRVYDPVKDTAHTLLALQQSGIATWKPDGSGVIIAEAEAGGGMRIVDVPLKGKPRPRFSWPRPVLALAPSMDDTRLAVADAGGVAIVTNAGHILATTRDVTPTAEQTNLRFSPDGKQLAIFVALTTGEPHIFRHEKLYTLEAATGVTTRVAQWEEQLGGEPGAATMRSLLGWAPAAPALLLAGKSGTVASIDTYWRRLWLRPLDPARPTSLLFESGSGVVDMAWVAREH